MKRFAILLFLTFVTVSIFAQGEASFTVSTNASKVVKGGIFEVIFTLNNVGGKDFTPPSFKGFEIAQGPSIQSSRTIINGKISQSYSYGYFLKALKIGEQKIESATIKAGSKTLKTRPLKISVVPPATKAEAARLKDIFIKTELDVEEAYIGQQVIVTFTIYSTKKILKADLSDVPKFSNGFTQYLDISQFSNGVEVINGQQYYTVPAARYALIPHKEGELTIKDLGIRLKVLELSNFFSKAVDKKVMSETVTLNVTTLENPPEDFTNAIGTFKFDAILTKDELTMDAASTLTFNVEGTGDMKAISIPQLSDLENYFEVYEPTINTQIKEQSNRVISQKVFTYLLVPKKLGRFTYKPTFTYFNTDLQTFETLESDSFNIVIKKGTSNGKDESTDFSNDGVRDIKTIMSTTSFSNGKPVFFGSALFWILITLPFVGLLVAIFIKRNRIKTAGINPTFIKMTKADKVALQRLAKAKTFESNGEERAFYEEVSKTLWGYLSDKLVIPQSELSKDNIRSKLVIMDVPTPTVEQFIQILNTCELAIFAKMGNATNMQSIYDDTKDVIVTLEESLGKH